jgi:4-diphosphocytidyl-2C-methyl-D-erythritol kinase
VGGEKSLNYKLAIIVADGGVSTKEAYALFDKVGEAGKNNSSIRFLQEGDLNLLVNDLEKPAMMLNKNIALAKEQLIKLGADAAVMSGSGSAVVGYFKKEIPKNNIKGLIKTKLRLKQN